MKKTIIVTLILALRATSSFAQIQGMPIFGFGAQPRLCFDANLMVGDFVQNLNALNTIFDDPASTKNYGIGSITHNMGITTGGDFQLGYFVGRKLHFGIGTGIMYMHSSASVFINGQNISSENTIHVTNMNVPVVLKYRTNVSDNVDFAIDGGIVYNSILKNSFTINQNTEGILSGNYKSSHASNNGSVGLLVRPVFSFGIAKDVYLNTGIYYVYQTFNNSNSGIANYERSNNYNALLSAISSTTFHTYGITIGIRIMFGKLKDTDHDGIPDRKDRCPTVYGNSRFNGCPDSDGDGIADIDDSCPHQAGPATLHGCPDTDGDGIADKDDDCPNQAGLAQYNGCPDSDGDGVPDNKDKCPNLYGSPDNNGCPVYEKQSHLIVGEVKFPLLFDFNKVSVNDDSRKLLEKVVDILKENRNVAVTIIGYTDDIGSDEYNKKLAQKRANAIKEEIKKMGVNVDNITTIAYGKVQPAEKGITDAERSKNRCAVININDNAYSNK